MNHFLRRAHLRRFFRRTTVTFKTRVLGLGHQSLAERRNQPPRRHASNRDVANCTRQYVEDTPVSRRPLLDIPGGTIKARPPIDRSCGLPPGRTVILPALGRPDGWAAAGPRRSRRRWRRGGPCPGGAGGGGTDRGCPLSARAGPVARGRRSGLFRNARTGLQRARPRTEHTPSVAGPPDELHVYRCSRDFNRREAAGGGWSAGGAGTDGVTPRRALIHDSGGCILCIYAQLSRQCL